MIKPRYINYLALLCAFGVVNFGLIGCATDEQANELRHQTATVENERNAGDEATVDDENKPPRLGMTKSQVRARYGEPDSVYVTPNGEAWSYSFNAPGFLWQIPGYGLSRMFSTQKGHHLHVAFGSDGRVKTYNFSENKSALKRMF